MPSVYEIMTLIMREKGVGKNQEFDLNEVLYEYLIKVGETLFTLEKIEKELAEPSTKEGENPKVVCTIALDLKE